MLAVCRIYIDMSDTQNTNQTEDSMEHQAKKTTDADTVHYVGPALDHDYTLAELVGLPAWRLVLVCDWGERTMVFDSRLASDNGTPGDEWHGHAQAFFLEPMTRADALQLLEELTPLVGKVCDGYASEWNGRNHVGELTADARDAVDEIEYTIHSWQYDHPSGAGELWPAAEWFDAFPPTVAASATDSDLEALAGELQADAHADGIHLHGLDEYLEGLRAEA